MKKNITINLFGQLFNIDEDAYELLKNYEEALHQYFNRQEGGAEIANDLESRIAELLSELKAQGTEAITIEHVQDIIKRIGRPEEIGQEVEEDAGNGPETAASGRSFLAEKLQKRYYRDGDNKMVAGVLAGLSKYFGGDVTIWRLGFLVLCVAFGGYATWVNGVFERSFPLMNISLPLIYIVTAIVAPVAKTPAERLHVKGVKVTPQTLADEVSAEAMQREQAVSQPHVQRGARGCVAGFLSVCATIFKILLAFCGVTLFVPILFMVCFMAALLFNPEFVLENMFDSKAAMVYQIASFPFWILCICILLACFIPAYCAMHAVMNAMGKAQPMGIGQRLTWLILWTLSVAGIVASSVKIGSMSDEIEDQIKEEIIERNTHEGFLVTQWEWDWLQQNGWKIVECTDNDNQYWESGVRFNEYTSCGNYYLDDVNDRYLDAYGTRVQYQVEHSEAVAPGRYRLTYVARANNKGAHVYAKTASGEQTLDIVPAGDTGGTLWQAARMFVDNATEAQLSTDQGQLQRRIAEANNGMGRGWSRYETDLQVGKDSLVTYGVVFDGSKQSDVCVAPWFSATDFRLERIK
ncbi:MAG: PspC domain-containing protein [Prevotella sp.]|nr:PspC domain-containing protein [Prevotella sp.]